MSGEVRQLSAVGTDVGPEVCELCDENRIKLVWDLALKTEKINRKLTISSRLSFVLPSPRETAS
jgi:hypothetical protein